MSKQIDFAKKHGLAYAFNLERCFSGETALLDDKYEEAIAIAERRDLGWIANEIRYAMKDAGI